MVKYSCDMCRVDFAGEEELENHMRQIHGLSYYCPYGSFFAGEQELKDHANKHHKM